MKTGGRETQWITGEVNWTVDLQISLEFVCQSPRFSRKIMMEIFLGIWKHHFELGNNIVSLETSILILRYNHEYGKVIIFPT